MTTIYIETLKAKTKNQLHMPKVIAHTTMKKVIHKPLQRKTERGESDEKRRMLYASMN
jgi:hypothetical protein